jgi:hypothetical protein
MAADILQQAYDAGAGRSGAALQVKEHAKFKVNLHIASRL